MSNNFTYDLIVVGSGAAGLATAITAKKRGLSVAVLEKEPVFGGTTALSGGVLWVPLGPHSRKQNPADTREAARTYLMEETGTYFDAEATDVFLDNGPKMVEFFERETEMKFVPTLYPDYHPTVKGGVDIGRAILAAPFDIRGLGADMPRLKPPLKTITFIGMMFNSSNADLKHFFQATKSLTSFIYVAKRLATHIKELALYRRGINVTSGNALAARLAKSALDLQIPIYTNTPAKKVQMDGDRVVGVLATQDGQEVTYTAKHGVVLACGGFPHDIKRIAQAYPHLKRGGEHLSPTPTSNTGDGTRMAEELGGVVDIKFKDASAWMPVSKVVYKNGEIGVFPHLLDRYKPGIIGVLRNGKRFTNESNSYHDVGAAMIRACENQTETAMWLVGDKTTLAKYGIGFVKPAPMPIGQFLRNGYLIKGNTVAELAKNAGIDPQGLEETIKQYNLGAVNGEDREFGRGTTSFNRYLADPENKPNPCVAPIQNGPFYAVKVIMGDLGTFDGIKTTPYGEVLKRDGSKIENLYAVGNDRASMMGGNYPGAGITHGPNMTFGFVTGNYIADKAN
ncbi:FAD-dependent oxidoreductase [Polynucleobacter sp. MWH-Spelu-300-X4]|uniref:FAD-dependent oxidoreductase n=1 Tax=Polynucleobacter sp. MWH-Spelu-300-X4 TaxID=2689109 RepID=UPI001BFE5BA0|nr:FAD-dependent oxidoreductase [Polynucleobacter sp. MWH-Spelu-300-X4]QWD79385.1 FAD-dependent oxidoreductase [Polynucleobacter sp. MWH-Spelu-300-X4]